MRRMYLKKTSLLSYDKIAEMLKSKQYEKLRKKIQRRN